MSLPVITTPISPRIIAAGVAFSQAMAASNTPTSWAASGLPSGLTINTSTGVISGTPLSQVQTTASITATNGTGTSAAVQIIFVVMATPPGMGGPFDIVLDYELTTNEVSMPGVTPPAIGAPLFYAPRGTNRFLLVGVKYYGVLQDLNPAAEAISIRLGMKELEPERLLEVTTAATTKVAAMPDDQQRYRIPFRVNPANWGVLGDYESDAATIISALAELQVSVGTVATLSDATLTDSAIALQGNVTTPITGDHDFTAVTQFATATPMRLTLTLSVADRPLQTVTLIREFSLIYTGGAFVISGATGATTGTGAVDGTQWRATLNLTALTGDANSVDADYSITTSADTTDTRWEKNFTGDGLTLADPTNPAGTIAVGAGYVLELWDGENEFTDTLIGTWTPDGTYPDTAQFELGFAAGWETASGASDVIGVDFDPASLTVIVTLEDSTAVRFLRWYETSVFPSPFYAVELSGPTGVATTCSVSARLQQLESPDSIPLNLTSNQFRIGVARDLVPD